MVEADHIVTQTPAPNHAQRRAAERVRIAVRVEAQRRAREEVKAQIRREGRVKLSEVPAREITAMAEARLLEDVEYRAKLIAEAKAVVERWQWGHVVGNSRRPAAQGVPLNECHARNGAAK